MRLRSVLGWTPRRAAASVIVTVAPTPVESGWEGGESLTSVGGVSLVPDSVERAAPGGFMLKKGEVFGWAALLEGYPNRIASARCLEDSRVLRINGKRALAVLEKDPQSGFVVMRRPPCAIFAHEALVGRPCAQSRVVFA